MSPSLGKSPSHLFLRGTKFYFRKVLPPDLYDKIGVKEIKISLGSSSIKEARFLSSCLNLQMNQFIIFMRVVRPVDEEQITQIRNLAIEWVRKKKKELENLRAGGIYDFIVQIDGETGETIQTTSSQRIEAFQEVMEFEREKRRGDLLSDTWIERVAYRIAGENEIVVPKEGEPFGEKSLAYRRLCLELRKAFLDLGKVEIYRMAGGSGEYENVVAQENSVLPLVAVPKQQQQQQQKQKLSDLLQSYLDSKRLGKRISKKSISEIESQCGLFIEITGDPFVDDLEDRMIIDYLDALGKIPANRTKIKKYRNKSVKELIKKKIPEGDKMKEGTIINHINKVKSFVMESIENRGFYPRGRFSTLFHQKGRTQMPHEARAVFTEEDLKKIFYHEKYLHLKYPWDFWPPLIALFTGMRLNEVCQLHLADIDKYEEFWYIHVCPGEKKTLKNKNAIRKIPVHGQLHDIGFINYVKQLKRDGEKYLFPDRMSLKIRPGHTPGKYFNERIKKIGIQSKDGQEGNKCFHSFRHTFLTRCDRLSLREDWVERMTGHENNNQIRRTYVKPPEVPLLYEEIISKIYYDLDLTHLEEYMKESGYNPWGKKKTAKKRSGKQQKTIKRN